MGLVFVLQYGLCHHRRIESCFWLWFFVIETDLWLQRYVAVFLVNAFVLEYDFGFTVRMRGILGSGILLDYGF